MSTIATGMYSGRAPWGLSGVYVGEEPVLSSDAIELAQADWRVKLQRLKTHSGTDVPSHRAIVREDTGRVLGVAGKVYRPIQNSQVFKIADSLVRDDQMRFHTVGVIDGGKAIWALGKLGEAEILPGDHVDQFALFHTRHDGGGSLKVVGTSVRPCCSNMIRGMLFTGERKLQLRHSGNIRDKIDKAIRTFEGVREDLRQEELYMHALAEYQLRQSMMQQVLRQVIPDPERRADGTTPNPTRARQARELVTELLESGKGTDIPGVRGTAWGLRNALVEYCNYHRTTTGKDDDARQENRFVSSMWGASARLIETADEVLVEMLEAS